MTRFTLIATLATATLQAPSTEEDPASFWPPNEAILSKYAPQDSSDPENAYFRLGTLELIRSALAAVPDRFDSGADASELLRAVSEPSALLSELNARSASSVPLAEDPEAVETIRKILVAIVEDYKLQYPNFEKIHEQVSNFLGNLSDGREDTRLQTSILWNEAAESVRQLIDFSGGPPAHNHLVTRYAHAFLVLEVLELDQQLIKTNGDVILVAGDSVLVTKILEGFRIPHARSPGGAPPMDQRKVDPRNSLVISGLAQLATGFQFATELRIRELHLWVERLLSKPVKIDPEPLKNRDETSPLSKVIMPTNSADRVVAELSPGLPGPLFDDPHKIIEDLEDTESLRSITGYETPFIAWKSELARNSRLSAAIGLDGISVGCRYAEISIVYETLDRGSAEPHKSPIDASNTCYDKLLKGWYVPAAPATSSQSVKRFNRLVKPVMFRGVKVCVGEQFFYPGPQTADRSADTDAGQCRLVPLGYQGQTYSNAVQKCSEEGTADSPSLYKPLGYIPGSCLKTRQRSTLNVQLKSSRSRLPNFAGVVSVTTDWNTQQRFRKSDTSHQGIGSVIPILGVFPFWWIGLHRDLHDQKAHWKLIVRGTMVGENRQAESIAMPTNSNSRPESKRLFVQVLQSSVIIRDLDANKELLNIDCSASEPQPLRSDQPLLFTRTYRGNIAPNVCSYPPGTVFMNPGGNQQTMPARFVESASLHIGPFFAYPEEMPLGVCGVETPVWNPVLVELEQIYDHPSMSLVENRAVRDLRSMSLPGLHAGVIKQLETRSMYDFIDPDLPIQDPPIERGPVDLNADASSLADQTQANNQLDSFIESALSGSLNSVSHQSIAVAADSDAGNSSTQSQMTIDTGAEMSFTVVASQDTIPFLSAAVGPDSLQTFDVTANERSADQSLLSIGDNTIHTAQPVSHIPEVLSAIDNTHDGDSKFPDDVTVSLADASATAGSGISYRTNGQENQDNTLSGIYEDNVDLSAADMTHQSRSAAGEADLSAYAEFTGNTHWHSSSYLGESEVVEQSYVVEEIHDQYTTSEEDADEQDDEDDEEAPENISRLIEDEDEQELGVEDIDEHDDVETEESKEPANSQEEEEEEEVADISRTEDERVSNTAHVSEGRGSPTADEDEDEDELIILVREPINAVWYVMMIVSIVGSLLLERRKLMRILRKYR